MPEFFDIHSHLNFSQFDNDRDETIERLRETGTHTIVVGTDYESSKAAVELAENNEEIYACIGIHPVDNPSRKWEEDKFEELVKHPKVVAIGECGLDFHHAEKEKDFERQKELFLDQIDFSLKHDRPLMIHVRDAYEELLEILEPIKRENPKLSGNIHFFAASPEIAKKFVDLGFTLSFTGAITFSPSKNQTGWRDPNIYAEVIRSVPLEFIMSETDSPYVAPTPHRGKRNEPSYVQEVVKRIAEIRGEDLEVVKKALVSNAFKLFKI